MTNMRDDARWLVDQVSEAKAMAKALGKPQLGTSSIESGKIEEYDSEGTLTQIIGEQHDGTHTAASVAGPTPPEPVAATATVGLGSAELRWNGKFVEGAMSPMDFSHVSAHGSRLAVFSPDNTTKLADIAGESGDVATVLLEPGEWTIGLVAVSKSGKWSEMSETITVEILDFPSPVDIQQELIDLDVKMDGAITEAGSLGTRLEQAETDLDLAGDRLDEAATRLDDAFGQISTVDGKATAASSAASSAQSKADTAKSAADQAAADALAASGLAAGKGKVLVQSSAPVAADRNAVTLWIDTTGGANTPKRWTTGTTWVAVTDKAATDAAAAAATAKGVADAAASAAAAAQSAAGTAQSTADSALTMAGSATKAYYSTSTPSGVARTDRDIWRQINATKDVIGEWFWDATLSTPGWVKTLISSQSISNLDVGKLTVGTGIISDLVAEHIAGRSARFIQLDVSQLVAVTGTMSEAVITKLFTDVVMSRKITAEMVAIGSFENLIPDDQFATDAGKIWYAPAGGTGSGFSSEVTYGSSDKSAVMPLKTGNPSTGALYAPYLYPEYRVPVSPGEVYYITSWAYLDASSIGNVNTVQQRVYHYATKSGTIINAMAGASITNPPLKTWFQVGGLFTVPAGSYYISPRLTMYYPNNVDNTPAGGRWFMSAPKMVRANGGELVLDGSMKARHIDVEDLAASTGFIADLTARIVKSDMFVGKEFIGGIFTGSTFQTSILPDAGLKLDGQGMRAYGPEGGEPVVEINTTGAKTLGVTDPVTGETLAAFNSDGEIVGRALSVNSDPVVMGANLLGDLASWESPSDLEHSGILDPIPRGIAGFLDVSVAGRDTTFEMELGEFSYEHDVRRAYRFHVEPLTVYASKESFVNLLIRRTTDGSAPTMNSAILRSITTRDRSGGTISSALDYGGTFYHIASDSHTARLLITLQISGDAATTASIIADPIRGTLRVWVEDIGPHSSSTGMPRNGKKAGAATTTPPAPVTPVKKNYTQTWKPSGSRSFDGNNRYTYADGKDRIYQGNGGYTGMLRSMVTFGNGSKGQSITAATSGATITSIRVKLYFIHWHYGSGGTAQIMLHGQATLPTTLPSMTLMSTQTKWPRAASRWVSVPKAQWANFQNGTWKGFGLGNGGSGLTFYGYARASDVELEIKYTK